MSDPIKSPDFEPKSAFKLTRTSQPRCLRVPRSRGPTLHPGSPEGTASSLTDTLCASLARAQRPEGLFAPLRTRTSQRKQYLGDALRCQDPCQGAAATRRLTGRVESVGLVTVHQPRSPGPARPAPPALLAPRLPAPAPGGQMLRTGQRAHTTHTGAGTLLVAAASPQPAEPQGSPDEDGAHSAFPSGQTDVLLVCPCALQE